MRKTRGFTLIEMLVVIAVVSILASVVLVGVRNFQASARDTKRVADIRNAQNLLELYYTKCGNYPGNGADCSVNTSLGTWAAMIAEMEASNILSADAAAKLDRSEDTAAEFDYANCDAGQRYVVGVTLEQGNRAAIDDDAVPGSCSIGIACADQDVFCVTAP